MVPSLASASSVSSQSARQLVVNALDASRSARSFSIKGFVNQPGQRVGLNLTVSNAGRAKGSVTLNGQTIHLIEITPEVYFSAGEKFWVQSGVGKSEAASLANRWVGVSSSNASFASFNSFLNLKKISAQFFPAPPAKSVFTKGRTSTVNGQSVIAISGTGTSGGNGTLYVATSGTPYVIRLSASQGKSGVGTITFSNYNRSFSVSAPRGAIKV
jgi:hypothetical protein